MARNPSMPKEVKALLDQAVEQGFTWRTTRKKGHIQVLNSEGKIVAGTGGSPSDWRSLLNFRAQLRRAGAVVK